MPIYEYRCKDCDYQFEMLRKYAESQTIAACPHCEGRNTTKMMPKVNAFVGSGSEHRAVASGCGSCNSASSGGCSSCRSH